MDIVTLKNYIYENQYIETVLEDIGCHSIRYHDSYFTCGNPDGDNPSAITVYNTEWLGVVNYTRQIINSDRKTDLIDLVCYTKSINFVECLKYLSQLVGLDYYQDLEEEIPESLVITGMLRDMKEDIEQEKEKPLKPISEHILDYYLPYVNDMFAKDGIPYDIQREFEIGYDPETNRITIPIRDSLSNLVGVKGRLFKDELDDYDMKYLYIERCAKSKILYGLYKTMQYIKEYGVVYVVEAEKGVMQLCTIGYPNCVATGGKTVSRTQVEMLIRLGVKIIFCFDNDVTIKDIEKIYNMFPEGVDLYYMKDYEGNILKKKESPSDNEICWNYMVDNCVYKFGDV